MRGHCSPAPPSGLRAAAARVRPQTPGEGGHSAVIRVRRSAARRRAAPAAPASSRRARIACTAALPGLRSQGASAAALRRVGSRVRPRKRGAAPPRPATTDSSEVVIGAEQPQGSLYPNVRWCEAGAHLQCPRPPLPKEGEYRDRQRGRGNDPVTTAANSGRVGKAPIPCRQLRYIPHISPSNWS